jgi:hypothetical protein
MNNFKTKIIEFINKYNSIKVDEEPSKTIEDIKKFIEVSEELIVLINDITDIKKSHLYILEDFIRKFH